MLYDLFPEGVAMAWGDPLETSNPLFPEEEALVAKAVWKRQREFAKGRECARRALSGFGRGDAVLLSGKDREPLWPPNIVGSITHTRGLCAVAVALSDRYRGLGIDAEPAEPLSSDVTKRVCRDDEASAASGMVWLESAIVSRLVFCAKEAVYKCIFPMTRAFLGFEDVSVEIGDGTLSARLHVARPPLPPDSTISGRWLRTGEHLVASAWIDRSRSALP